MTLGLEEVRRFGRQIALPAIAVAGQERIVRAEVALVGREDDVAIESARLYLAAAGVGTLRRASAPHGPGWVEALWGATLVVRSGFEDDAMLGAAARLGIPVVVARARRDGVDLVSFRRPRKAPVDLDVAPSPRQAPHLGAEAVLAGTLAAAEALWMLVAPDQGPGARLLRLPLSGGDCVAQELPL